MLCLCSVTRPPYCNIAAGNLHADSEVYASSVTLWKVISSQSCDWFLNDIFIYLGLGDFY